MKRHNGVIWGRLGPLWAVTVQCNGAKGKDGSLLRCTKRGQNGLKWPKMALYHTMCQIAVFGAFGGSLTRS